MDLGINIVLKGRPLPAQDEAQHNSVTTTNIKLYIGLHFISSYAFTEWGFAPFSHEGTTCFSTG